MCLVDYLYSIRIYINLDCFYIINSYLKIIYNYVCVYICVYIENIKRNFLRWNLFVIWKIIIIVVIIKIFNFLVIMILNFVCNLVIL